MSSTLGSNSSKSGMPSRSKLAKTSFNVVTFSCDIARAVSRPGQSRPVGNGWATHHPSSAAIGGCASGTDPHAACGRRYQPQPTATATAGAGSYSACRRFESCLRHGIAESGWVPTHCPVGLTRQPGGFEGFCFLAKPLVADDLAVLEAQRRGEGVLQPDTAALPLPCPAPGNDHDGLTCFDHLVDLEPDTPEGRPHPIKCLSELGGSASGSRFYRVRRVNPLNTIIEDREEGLEVAHRERAETAPHDLHVLPRHRLLRQPLA